ncbi:MAG: hypothetical protein ACLP6E_18845 [Acidimicrobiales bacterium]
MTTGSHSVPQRSMVEAFVDTDRYPLRDLDLQVGSELVRDAKEQLRTSGYAELPGFLNARGVSALVEDAGDLACRSHPSAGSGTAYLELPDPEVPEGHPRRWTGRFSLRAVPYDLIPRSSPLRQIYEWDPLTELVSAILGRGPLYRYSDPFGALNLAVMGEGDELQWHFDQTDFVVSLAIQTAGTGGDFEVAPLIRSDRDERFTDVAEVLSGDTARVRTIAMNPGTLLIFEGRNSLHRVSPISAPRLRHVGLLAYDTRPGTTGSELLRISRYGRTEPFEEPPDRWPDS